MRTVAITGASGFIGSHVAAAFAGAGWQCRVLLRPGAARPQTPVEVVTGTLEEPARLARLVAGADAVVHAAGLTASRDPDGFAAVNVAGTARLVEAWAGTAPNAALVALSSLAAREPGLSPYAASKAAGEGTLAGRPGAWTILRPAAVYGPRDAATRALFRMGDGPMQPMLGPKDATLCLIHVEDVARAALAAAEARTPGARWELSDHRRDGYSWREMATALARALGRTPRPVSLPTALIDAAGWAAVRWPRLQRVTGPLSPEKISELRHLDWSSSDAAQPPVAVWSPRLGIAAGFDMTVAALRAEGSLGRQRDAGPMRRAIEGQEETT